ncbi:hypothetical protein K7X08_023016 [Anisodus acutangulus]|uniref:Uncharacterized protein n=1 Tax=Anisodus acutangulus TaxID=402998 RepID=A0A9Q1MBP4_9SOLA|nr:hypothetical protein K7X08_023016 [Anisodus acutangulus]
MKFLVPSKSELGNEDFHNYDFSPYPVQVHEQNIQADQTASSAKENEQVHELNTLVVAGDGVVPPKKVHEVNMQADQTESSVKENEEVIDSHLVTARDGVKDIL